MDPDGETFWAFNAYGQQNNAWGTWLAAFKCSDAQQGHRRQLLRVSTPSVTATSGAGFMGAVLAPGGTGYTGGAPAVDLGNSDTCM